MTMTRKEAIAACRKALEYGRGSDEVEEIIAALSPPSVALPDGELRVKERWKCLCCGRDKFEYRIGHKCVGGQYRRRGLKWERLEPPPAPSEAKPAEAE